MEPITVTAAAIVGFIFTTAAETVITKATEAVLPKINELRQKIISKLNNREKAKVEIEKFEQDKKPNLELLASYLNFEMEEDAQFKEEIANLADEINQELEEKGEGSRVINVYGGKYYEQSRNTGTIYNADSITIHQNPKS